MPSYFSLWTRLTLCVHVTTKKRKRKLQKKLELILHTSFVKDVGKWGERLEFVGESNDVEEYSNGPSLLLCCWEWGDGTSKNLVFWWNVMCDSCCCTLFRVHISIWNTLEKLGSLFFITISYVCLWCQLFQLFVPCSSWSIILHSLKPKSYLTSQIHEKPINNFYFNCKKQVFSLLFYKHCLANVCASTSNVHGLQRK